MNFLAKAADKFVHSNSLAFTAIRSTLSAQISGWVDFATGFAFFAWVGFKPVFATAMGAIMGGATNCIINYKFTYHTKCRWNVVIVKFIIVWFIGMLLNSFGTEGLYWLYNRWQWLEDIGFKRDGYFTLARLSAGLVVSVFWHFLMQQNFVYKTVWFDKYAERISAVLFHPLSFRKHLPSATDEQQELTMDINPTIEGPMGETALEPDMQPDSDPKEFS